jgi:hypothetical protein
LFLGADSGPVGEKIRKRQKSFKGPISKNLRLSALKIFKRKCLKTLRESGAGKASVLLNGANTVRIFDRFSDPRAMARRLFRDRPQPTRGGWKEQLETPRAERNAAWKVSSRQDLGRHAGTMVATYCYAQVSQRP